MNGYGPTEATISCNMKALDSPENITIGIPNANVQVAMLDEKNKPLPIGTLGELTILGDGVGCGYINRDDLTREKFTTLWGKPAYKSGDLATKLQQMLCEIFKYPTAEKFEAYILSQDTVDRIRHKDLGNVLLTGATRFLGIHVLYDLLKNTAIKIFCFVRKGKAPSAKERLKNLFIYYFDSTIQISTVSIAGDNIDQKIPKDARLAESDFYLGQEVTSNKYVYSKFQAEELGT